ncbi:hypothetical protein Golomagni_00434 [Golovinomyces magnicellulatus]|nr:hypothetical protein Golomagni_00434 [Golovinomyces magnicellulatus]
MDQPPPPPPHGQNPKSTSSGLPPGNYDIFIIPPHSSGSGFLYLPSLKPNVNSFAAGFASALILVVVASALSPIAKIWWKSAKGADSAGVIILMFAIAVGAWALGRMQAETGAQPNQNRRNSHTNEGGNRPNSNSGTDSGSKSSNSYKFSHENDPGAGSRPDAEPTPDPNQRGSKSSQWQCPPDTSSPEADSASAAKNAKEKFRDEARKKDQMRQERLRREQEKQEQQRREQERLERERREQEKQEQQRQEQERLERERREQDKLEREKREQERLEREKREQERLEREKREQDRLEREKREQERLEREKREQDRLEREKREQEKQEQERREQERLDRERREREEAKKKKEDLEKRLRELREKDARERAAREQKLQEEAERAAQAKLRKEQEERDALRRVEEALAIKQKELEAKIREEYEAKRSEEQAAAAAIALAEKKRKEEEDRLRRRREYEARAKKKKADEEAARILEEAKRKFEEATKRLEEEEMKKKQEEEAKKKQLEEARKKRQEEIKRRREEMIKKKQEEESRKSREEEARKKLTENYKSRQSTTYAFTAGEKTNPWPQGRPVLPNKAAESATSAESTPNNATKQFPSTTGTKKTTETPDADFSSADDSTQKNPSSSLHSGASHAPLKSTPKTKPPPPSKYEVYHTKDPTKIVIKAVYSFNNAFLKTPTSQLVSGVGSVTDGLILRITTEGLFIDDDVRGVPQREWDIKAWTMKMVEIWCPSCQDFATTPASMRAATSSSEVRNKNPTMRRLWGLDNRKTATAEEIDALLTEMLSCCKSTCSVRAATSSDRNNSPARSTYSTSSFGDSAYCGSNLGQQTTDDADYRNYLKGLHVLRASIRDQEGKKFIFIISQGESWKISLGLQRLRKGTQVRALGVYGKQAGAHPI